MNQPDISNRIEEGYAEAFADFHYISHKSVPIYIQPS